MTATKKSVGRPQKTIEQIFPENWKDLVIEWSMQGWSEAEIRVGLCQSGQKFHTELWYSLQKREEEFSKTLQMAKVIRQAWWERQARENIKETHFQTGLWYACMKNMFGYRDKQEETQSDETKGQELGILDVPLNGNGKDRFARYLN